MVVTFDLRSDGTALTGTVGDVMGETDVEERSVIDEVVSFVQAMGRENLEIRFKYEAQIAGDQMELTRSVERRAGGRRPQLASRRSPPDGTPKPSRAAVGPPAVAVVPWVGRSRSRRGASLDQTDD